MPADLYPFLLTALLVAVTASAAELRASLREPVCPRCVHCRHAALERKARDVRERNALAKRLWGIDDVDDDEGRRP